MNFSENLADMIWWFFWVFAFIAYLFTLFAVVGDLFRDPRLGGWGKAMWMIFLTFIPFLALLLYLIVRGNGMAERQLETAHAEAQSADDYIRQIAAPNPVAEISKAKALLDSGIINDEEFRRLKDTALI